MQDITEPVGPAPRQLRWIAHRVRTAVRPDVEVVAAPPMAIDWDVPVQVRDGTVLRANVFRPADGSPVPVIMAAHPYGKDRIPARTRSGRGRHLQYRLFPQPAPVRISELTSWEAPDPGWWVPNGYAVVNADLRGRGTGSSPAARCGASSPRGTSEDER